MGLARRRLRVEVARNLGVAAARPDLHEWLRKISDAGPVFRVTDKLYLITGYGECKEVLISNNYSDEQRFEVVKEAISVVQHEKALNLVEDIENTSRQAVKRGFSQSEMRHVSGVVNEAVGTVIPDLSRPVEAVSEICSPISQRVFSALVSGSVSEPSYVDGLAKTPAQRDELVTILETFFSSLPHQLSLSILHLATKRILLPTRPVLASALADEMLRIDSAVPFAFRQSTRSLRLGGETIPKGAGVVCSLVSANRDETVFERPYETIAERFVRRQAPILTFGFGARRCLGAALSKYVIQSTILHLAKLVQTMSGRALRVLPGEHPKFDAPPFRGVRSLNVAATN